MPALVWRPSSPSSAGCCSSSTPTSLPCWTAAFSSASLRTLRRGWGAPGARPPLRLGSAATGPVAASSPSSSPKPSQPQPERTPMTESRPDTSGLQRLVADLSSIEFDSASDVRRYIVTLRDACKVLAVELEFASDDLEQRLRAVPPMGDDETGVVIARRARQVAKHLRRSAEAAREVGISAVKTWTSLKTHFGDHMGQRRPEGRQINLQS